MRSRVARLSLSILVVASSMVLETGPAWAEELLVYSFKATEAEPFAIYTQMPNAVDQRTPLVTLEGGEAWCPRVSLDGTRLALIEKTTGMIYVANIDGSGLVPLGNTVPASALDWSLDNATLYFWGAADRTAPHSFYSIPAAGGAVTPLFGGQTFWCWFYDGGFDAYPVQDPATGELVDMLLWSASQTGPGNKVDLLRLPASTAAAAPIVMFGGLGDNYTPSYNRLTGQLLFQADHDRAGSHAIYFLDLDGSTNQLSGLYGGNPVWSLDLSTGTPAADRWAYVGAPQSTFGATAYQGTLYVVGMDGVAVAQNSSGIAACPAFFNAP
jgi:hypothetical protein